MPMMLPGPRPPYMAGGPMQTFQPMMMAPQRPPAGFLPPPGFPQAPYPQPPMGPQLVAGVPRSATVTPKAAPNSGAATPLHPMQRTLSAGQLLAAPLPPPAFLQPLSVQYMVPPPPDIVLPESLSPVSPGGLRPAAAAASAPSSRAQSAAHAAHAAHARAGSFGGPAGPMEPLARAGLQRAGSAGCTSGSLRSSLELGSLGGAGSGAPFQPGGASRAPSHAGSRVGSAARKGSAAAVPPPDLDEFDNIKVASRFCSMDLQGQEHGMLPLCNHCATPARPVGRWRCVCGHPMRRSWLGAMLRHCSLILKTSARCVSAWWCTWFALLPWHAVRAGAATTLLSCPCP